jgi:hypothetical protein
LHAAPLDRRRTRAVVPWAVAGTFFIGLEIYIFTAWFLSGQAHRVHPGSSKEPHWWVVFNTLETGVGIVATVLFFYCLVYRQWKRAGQLTFDGMLCIACLTAIWQDPLINYTQVICAYNANLWNIGSWAEHIPGWSSPNGSKFPDPLLQTIPVYVAFWVGIILLGNRVMTLSRSRWPRLGNAGLVLLVFAFFSVLDLIIEPVWEWSGYYILPGASRSWTIFGGHYYQFPLFETILFCGCCSALASLRFFRNDKGETIAERGVGDLKIRPKAKRAARLLAVVGAVNLTYLVSYGIPLQWFATHSSAWPQDVLDRSYFTTVCGPGTTYACGGPAIPIARPGSAHLDPRGALVMPRGVAADTALGGR